MPLEDLLMPPGISYAQAQRRLNAPSFWLPTLLSDGAVTASSSHAPITATASATPHTKGAWVQVVASMSADCHFVTMATATNTASAGVNTSTLLDIGVGGAGSEVVVAANLEGGYKHSSYSRPLHAFPLTIPKGSRVAVRIQSVVVSKVMASQITFWSLPHGKRPATYVDTIGADTATSKGVTIAGTSVNTKSAYTEIISSTTQPYGALAVSVSGAADTALVGGFGLLDIAVGGSGSEVVIGADFPLIFDTGPEIASLYLVPGTISQYIPMGSRLSARWARDSTGNSLDVILHACPVT